MIGIVYIGTDGSSWDLYRGPVQLTDKGIEGLGAPPIQFYTQETGELDGQFLTGWRAKARPVFLPLLLGVALSPEEWLEQDRAWSAANAIGEFGVLVVTAPDGAIRRLPIRFVDDGNQVYPVDPSIDALSLMGYRYVADEPWWQGENVGQSYGNTTPVPFFGGIGGGGFGPPFFITSSNATGAATFNNPGEIDAWPVIIVKGPATSFSVTIDGGTVAGAIALLAGDVLTIDTAPTAQSAELVSGGVSSSVMPQLTAVSFRRIPAGGTAPMALALAGSGSIEIRIVPKFKKAW